MAKKHNQTNGTTSAKQGRPGTFTPEVGEQICALMSEGLSVLAISKMEGMPKESTIRSWARRESPRAKASKTRRTISTFSCDIAHAVSRQAEWGATPQARQDIRAKALVGVAWRLGLPRPSRYGLVSRRRQCEQRRS